MSKSVKMSSTRPDDWSLSCQHMIYLFDQDLIIVARFFSRGVGNLLMFNVEIGCTVT
jgi:hypothetical protein